MTLRADHRLEGFGVWAPARVVIGDFGQCLPVESARLVLLIIQCMIILSAFSRRWRNHSHWAGLSRSVLGRHSQRWTAAHHVVQRQSVSLERSGHAGGATEPLHEPCLLVISHFGWVNHSDLNFLGGFLPVVRFRMKEAWNLLVS